MQAVIKRGFGVTLGVIALAIGFTAPERERAYAQGGGADTHGRDATPDYGRVFIQDQVSRLDLKIAASDWQIAIDDMTDMAGAAGGQFGGGQQPGGGQPPGGFPGGGQPPGGFPDGGSRRRACPVGVSRRSQPPLARISWKGVHALLATHRRAGDACRPRTGGAGVCCSRWPRGHSYRRRRRIRHAMTSNSCPDAGLYSGRRHVRR